MKQFVIYAVAAFLLADAQDEKPVMRNIRPHHGEQLSALETEGFFDNFLQKAATKYAETKTLQQQQPGAALIEKEQPAPVFTPQHPVENVLLQESDDSVFLELAEPDDDEKMALLDEDESSFAEETDITDVGPSMLESDEEEPSFVERWRLFGKKKSKKAEETSSDDDEPALKKRKTLSLVETDDEPSSEVFLETDDNDASFYESDEAES